MKIFAYEHGVGGGMSGPALQTSLKYRGEMMLRALIADLAVLPGIDVITLVDPRAPLADLPDNVQAIAGTETDRQSFSRCVLAADAVWPVAPESSGVLAHLSSEVLRHQRILLGSRPVAVRTAASKQQTAQRLAGAGITVVATYSPNDPLPDAVRAWVVKPDDGVGCVDTRIFHDMRGALDWIDAHGDDGYVLQPYIAGKPCSLSLLCCDGMAWVLSCDEQRIAVRNNQFHYLGSTINSLSSFSNEWSSLARRIVKAIPGLWGYVGVDFIMTDRGAVVLGINPRLTPTYTGLHASIGCNPAGLVLGLLNGTTGLAPPAFEAVTVSVDADTFGVR